MIKVTRTEPPGFFSSDAHEELRNALQSFYEDYGATKLKRQSDFNWGRLSRALKEIRRDLERMFQSKCAYCETPISVAGGDVEHHRPKRGARGFDDRYFDTHYWWLALTWDNLLLACVACNRFKASWFPVRDEADRAEEMTPWSDLEGEGALLLDPCNDDPDEHLRYTDDGYIEPLTDRGKATVDIIQLNRSDLVTARSDRLRRALDAEQTDATTALRVFSRSELPYLGIQRQFLATQRDEQSILEEMPADVAASVGDEIIKEAQVEWTKQQSLDRGTKDHIATDAEDLGRLPLERIQLHNFKNIVDLTIEVPRAIDHGDAPWLMFLGANAVGKSSVLQAIALTLMGEERRNELVDFGPDRVLRFYKEDGEVKTTDEGWVKIWVTGRAEPLTLEFANGDEAFTSNFTQPGTHLLAYGPTRLLPSDDEHEEHTGRVRVRNLFEPATPLVDVNGWLWDLAKRERDDPTNNTFDLMVRGLRKTLLMKDTDTIEPDLDEPDRERMIIEFKNEATTINNLSDGYRSMLALAGDLMHVLQQEGTSMSEAEGIVIVDEVGSNLHPGWKKRVVGILRDVFPRIQFIVTSHEPLCLRGLHGGETVLLRRDPADDIIAISDLPDPNELRVDQILASEFFGLSSTVESEVEEIYDEYYALLTKQRPNRTERQRMAELKDELRDREHLGHSLRDELMYDVIDRSLAEQLLGPGVKSRPQLKKETFDKVVESWIESGLYDEFLSEDRPSNES